MEPQTKASFSSYPNEAIVSLFRLTTLARNLFRIAKLVKSPERVDLVLELYSDLYTKPYLKALQQTAPRTSSQIQIPSIGELKEFPQNSFGRELFLFLQKENLVSEDILFSPKSSSHPELFEAFSKTHDAYHVLTGFNTQQEGEIGLQAFYLAQHPNPLAALLIAVALTRSLFFGLKAFVDLFDSACLGWRMGREARCVILMDWKSAWQKPLLELKKELLLRTPEASVKPEDCESFPRRA